MRKLSAAAALATAAAAGCDAEVVENTDPASVLEAWSNGHVVLPAEVSWHAPAGVLTERSEIEAMLQTLQAHIVPPIEKHHRVARARLGNGAFVFAAEDFGAPGLQLLYFPGDQRRAAVPVVSTYAATWNEKDAIARAVALATCFASTGHYSDPQVEATNAAALNAIITSFRLQPGLPDLTLEGLPERLGDNFITFGWTVGEIHGVDVTLVGSDGNLANVVGFFSAR